MNAWSRRRFLGGFSLAFASRSVLDAASEDSGEHTLVHVFLRGGADTLNIIVPHADDRY
jgi:uncharacterized protein (DUF1501 family)